MFPTTGALCVVSLGSRPVRSALTHVCMSQSLLNSPACSWKELSCRSIAGGKLASHRRLANVRRPECGNGGESGQASGESERK